MLTYNGHSPSEANRIILSEEKNHMTWYATEVFARCTDSMLAAVMHDPLLAPHAYLIDTPIEYQISHTPAVFVPPAGGLLVIRPVCDPDTHCAEWHGSGVLSWHALSGQAGTQALAPDSLGEQLDSDRRGELPPDNFFRYLKELSVAHKADLVYFYCFMWGGATEVEYASFFGAREEVAFVVEAGIVSTVARKDPANPVELVELDLLSDALSYLGAPLAAPFCILHTRAFPWESFKLVDASAPAGALRSAKARSDF